MSLVRVGNRATLVKQPVNAFGQHITEFLRPGPVWIANGYRGAA